MKLSHVHHKVSELFAIVLFQYLEHLNDSHDVNTDSILLESKCAAVSREIRLPTEADILEDNILMCLPGKLIHQTVATWFNSYSNIEFEEPAKMWFVIILCCIKVISYTVPTLVIVSM